jgi:hypothetical protein
MNQMVWGGGTFFYGRTAKKTSLVQVHETACSIFPCNQGEKSHRGVALAMEKFTDFLYISSPLSA